MIKTNTVRYNSDKGLSQERTLKCGAVLLKPGENEMTLTVPGGDLQSVVWDYLRLELDENYKPNNANRQHRSIASHPTWIFAPLKH